MDKVYERIEDGTTTHVSIREALDEVNEAMMGRISRERSVRTMSSGRTQHHIVYSDGRDVRMTLVDAPAVVEPEPGPKAWTGEDTRIVTAKGKRYVVGTIVPARPRTEGATSWIPEAYVSYWSERNGKPFGATRSACESRTPGTVGRAIWDAVSRCATAETDNDAIQAGEPSASQASPTQPARTAVERDATVGTGPRILITRARLYPVVARPGPAWQWSYAYTVDGGPRCQYGPGLVSLRRMLREKFGTTGTETWKSK